MDTIKFRVSNSAICSFSSFLNGVNSLQKEFAPREQILSFKSRPNLRRLFSMLQEANRKSQKLSTFEIMSEKPGGVLIHLSVTVLLWLLYIVFSFQNNTKNLDSTNKTDLDLGIVLEG